MKKKQRVKKSYEFSSIIQKKQFTSTPAFVLYYQPRKEDATRIGISVGKKLGNAVCRNKIKRQIRAMVDQVFTFEEPDDYIIIARPGFEGKDFATLKAQLAKARERALKPETKKDKERKGRK